MDSKLLRQFLALADSLHFGRASALCHISPSTLTRSIKQLEQQLGAELFLRDNRSVSLTREGLLFQSYARESLAQWELLQAQLKRDRQQLQGEISMYCSVTASYSFLYELLSAFRAQHPKIEIKLHTGDPEAALERVQAGQEDVTIAALPDSLASGLAFKPIGQTPLVFIVSSQPQHQANLALTNQDPDWQQLPMIVSETGLGRKRINRWFKDKGFKPNIYAQVAGHEAIVSMVSLGFGVGVVPKIVLDNSPLAEQVEVISVDPELDAYQLGLFTLEKKLKNPLVAAFWSSVEG